MNTQLYSAREKLELANLISIMIAYNITYVQEWSHTDNQYAFKLEP